MKRNKKEIPIYKIALSMDTTNHEYYSILASFTKVPTKYLLIGRVKHCQYIESNGKTTFFHFYPLSQKITWAHVKMRECPINIDFLRYQNPFSKENTQQAFVERIKKAFLPTFPISKYVVFATPNKEDFLSSLKQLPIIIETIFKNKVVLGKEPKEHYYKEFINPIIEHVNHDN